jgi:hypothetical protein
MIDKIFKIGLLLSLATFLWLYSQDVQKNRYRIWPGPVVFDTVTGRIYSEDGNLTDPVKRAQAYAELLPTNLPGWPLGVPLNITTFRARYPTYKDVPDEELARRIREKYYPNVPEAVFNQAFLGELTSKEERP